LTTAWLLRSLRTPERVDALTFLAFSCTHCPLQDDEAVAWVLGHIAKRKPDVVIHLGDGHEGDAASRWNDEALHDLMAEYEAHNRLLASIRKAAPNNSRLVFLQGNHDANILARDRLDPRVRELLDWRRHEPELEHWDTKAEYEYDRKRGCFRIGQVCFAHGYDVSDAGIRREALYFAREFGLYVHGHTHRPTPEGPPGQLCATTNTPLNWWRANPGCLRELKPDYVKRKNTQLWGQGIVVGSATPLKSPRARKCWEAETIIFRDYDKWRDAT
jgi:predicted phosphodiesterase